MNPIEPKALSYVNMQGILGALPELCRLDGEAKAILSGMKHSVSLCFSVKNGPENTFHFGPGGCSVTEGSDGCTCRMNFSSPEKFNALITSGKPGIPVKAPIGTLRFLLGTFTKLTDRLSAVLQPKKEALSDPEFFIENTVMTLYVLGGAIPALANYDSISRISASQTADGQIQLGIRDHAYITLNVKDHHFSVTKEKATNPRAVMEFADVALAHGLFAGTVSVINEMCKGNIYLSGVLSMMDNVNRILDRAAVYLT